jgi:hypothetical protein
MNSLFRALKLLREPVKTFVQTLTIGGASGLKSERRSVKKYLDVPVALAERVETKLVSDLCGVHGVRQILLGKFFQK